MITQRTPEAAPAADAPQRNPWLILSVLCLGFFMILLDTTIVNIAIPDLIDDLGATLNQILWILNAYILVYAVLLITAGRLGDIHGPKRLFMIGLALFTVASIACGLAQDPAQLVVFRIAQGLGGALLTPQTLAVITTIFPAERRGAAFGVWGGVAGLATVAGPTLGGWLVSEWGWRWIFFVNVPVGVIALGMAAVIMPDLRFNRRHRLDLPGTALVTAGLFLICYGLIEGESHDWGRVWGPVTIPMVIAAGVGILALFVWLSHVRSDAEPLIPLRLFADRNFSVMNGVVAAVSFGMLGLFLPLTIYLQSVLGLTALQAGLTTAPMSLISMFVAPVAGRAADRHGKYVLLAGMTLWTAGLTWVVLAAQAGSDRGDLLPGLLVAGLGLGGVFAPLQTIAMRDIEPRFAGAASGVFNTTRQLGAVIGAAAVGALLQARLAVDLAAQARSNATALPEPFRERFVAAFDEAGSRGMEVGAGQSGAHLPAGAPPEIAQLALRTFHEGFTAAMKSTMVLPLIVLGVATVSVLLVRRRRSSAAVPRPTDATAAAVGDEQSVVVQS